MSKVDELKKQIEGLASEEFTEIFHWMSEVNCETWDREIVTDSQAGKLDFLTREVEEEKAKGNLNSICF
jgi:hypothetical protein